MPTAPRLFAPNTIHHVYNRGNQKMTLFYTGKDYERFLMKMREYKDRYPVDVLSYCLMPNHFHFLLREPNETNPKGLGPLDPSGSPSNISRFLHLLQTAYAKYFLAIHPAFSGRVFQGVFKSKLVEQESYLLQLSPYIHHNPVAAGLVAKPEEWPYSSYLDLIGISNNAITTNDPNLYEDSQQQIYQDFLVRKNEPIVTMKDLLFDDE